jgi:BRCA1-associated RING domain protein 1
MTPNYVVTQMSQHNEDLWIACGAGDYNSVIRLLDGPVDINYEGYTKETPLFVACRNGHLTIVKLLLERGADFNKTDVCSITPLLIAVSIKHIEIIRLLLDYGANRNTVSITGCTVGSLVSGNKEYFSEIIDLLESYENVVDIKEPDIFRIVSS